MVRIRTPLTARFGPASVDRLGIKSTERTMTVGHERLHAESLGQGEGLA
jgi:hypothetical protein